MAKACPPLAGPLGVLPLNANALGRVGEGNDLGLSTDVAGAALAAGAELLCVGADVEAEVEAEMATEAGVLRALLPFGFRQKPELKALLSENGPQTPREVD